jgi:hypothetical protein
MQFDLLESPAVRKLGRTFQGPGIRSLAVASGDVVRRYRLTLRSERRTVSGRLLLDQRPLAPGNDTASSEGLIQLPLPNFPLEDGYRTDGRTIYRYQFGRIDIVHRLRQAARELAAIGLEPILYFDLSQWDGNTPGFDVDDPRHYSHRHGTDLDVALYEGSGVASRSPKCQLVGNACIPGTACDFDPFATAILIDRLIAGSDVRLILLDRVLIAEIEGVLPRLLALGMVTSAGAATMRDRNRLRHWDKHADHLHFSFKIPN